MRLIANLFQIPQSLNNGDPASTDFSPLDNTYANILYKPITNGGATAAEKKKEYIPIQARVYETQIKLGHYQLLGFEVFNIGQDKKVNTEDDYMSFFAPKKEDFIMNLPSEIADHLLPVNFAVSANTETNIVVPIPLITTQTVPRKWVI